MGGAGHKPAPTEPTTASSSDAARAPTVGDAGNEPAQPTTTTRNITGDALASPTETSARSHTGDAPATASTAPRPTLTSTQSAIIATIRQLERLQAHTWQGHESEQNLALSIDEVTDRIKRAHYTAGPATTPRAALLSAMLLTSVSSANDLDAHNTTDANEDANHVYYCESASSTTPLHVGATVTSPGGVTTQVSVLADTGSPVSFVKTSTARALGLPTRTCLPFSFAGCVGTESQRADQCCDVPLDFDGAKINCTMYVVDDFPVDILWGRRDMAHANGNGIMIDPDPRKPRIIFDNGHTVTGETARSTTTPTIACATATTTTVPALNQSMIELTTSAPPGSHVQIDEGHVSAELQVQASIATVTENNTVIALVRNTTGGVAYLPAGTGFVATTTTTPTLMKADPPRPAETSTRAPPTAQTEVPADGRPISSADIKRGTTWDEASRTEAEYDDGAVNKADLPALLNKKIDDATANLTKAQRDRAKAILLEHIDVFSTAEDKFGSIRDYEINFRLRAGTKQIFVPPRKMSANKAKEATRQAHQLLREGVIHPTTSGFNMPLVLVSKGPGKAPRLCLDLREFNRSLIGEYFEIPKVPEVLATLSGSAVFSTVDATGAFQMIRLAADDGPVPSAHMLAFTLPNGERYAYRRLCFGVADASFSFSRVFSSILRSLQDVTAVYLDDCTIHTDTVETHITAMDMTLKTLKTAGAKLTPHKCHFLMKSIEVLGHVITKGSAKLNPEKIKAVRDLRPPTNKAETSVVYGLLGWSRRFIGDFASRARPLSNLLKGNDRWTEKTWTPECQAAFDDLKGCLCSNPILAAPRFDRPFELYTDASSTAIAGVLLQRGEDGLAHPIEYYSRLLVPAELKYSVPELETLAIVESVKKYRWYLLYGHPFKLRIKTDHKGLTSLYRQTEDHARIYRWAQTLSEFKHEIIWHAGTSPEAKLPDTLTRIHFARPTHHDVREKPTQPASPYDIQRLHAVLQGPGHNEHHAHHHVVAPVTRQRRKQAKQSTGTYDIDRLILPAVSATGTPGFRVRWEGYDDNDDTYEYTRNLKAGMTSTSWQSLLSTYLSSTPPPATLTEIPTKHGNGKGDWQPLQHPAIAALEQPPTSRLPEPFPDADLSAGMRAPPEARLMHQQRSNADIISAQHDDPLCQQIRRHLQGPVTASAGDDIIAQHAKQLAPTCFNDNASGLLMRDYTPTSAPRKGHPLKVIILPERLVPSTLMQCHDMQGHPGRDALTWYCRTRFYFSKMGNRISKYVKSCSACMRSMRDIRPAQYGHVPTTGLLDSIAIDFAGPLKAIGPDGFQYLCIITDHHSKWLMVTPTVTCSTADALACLRKWCETTGTFPTRIFSDRGAFARSELYQDFLKSFGIHPRLTVSLNPRGNGAAEAGVKNTKRMLKKLCLDHPYGWPSAATYAAMCYNQSYHSTLGTSPYFVRHGSHPRTTADILAGRPPPTDPTWSDAIEDRRAEIDEHVHQAVAALGDSYSQRNANLHGERTFAKGDLVYLHQVYPASFHKAGMDVKLWPAFGPQLFEITKIVSPQLSTIAEFRNPAGFTDTVHNQRLKPFTPREDAVKFDDFYDPLNHLDND